MLKEINCKYFIESPIKFENGLNVILGDIRSTNSIGKSTLLMIIDFVFGGSSFLEKDSGALQQIGAIRFNFAFEFDGKKFFYTRSTESPNIIGICDSGYHIRTEITVEKYTEQLKENYKLHIGSTFRAAVNPYSRIWGKDNYNVDKPILNSIKEPESTSIENLIKLFNLYHSIADTLKNIKTQEESKSILTGMFKKNIIPNVTKADFAKNEKDINQITSQINNIQDNLLKFTLNIEELSNKEMIELKTQKQKLLDAQSILQNKIRRLELNLSGTKVKSKYFNRLSQFFDNANEKKIEEIESFHTKISKILSREITSTLELLKAQEAEFRDEISGIDTKIDALLANVESPKFIVERIYDLTVQANQLKESNRFYTQRETVTEEVKKLTAKLDTTISSILGDIETLINDELIRINKEIHTQERKIPRINLKRKTYSFDHSSNTGTGKSFADLIEFDLSILRLTELPFIIHDSILFKNIEDLATDGIIRQYTKFDKQIFIAIDGINRLSEKSRKILNERCFLHLSESRKLFNRDWR